MRMHKAEVNGCTSSLIPSTLGLASCFIAGNNDIHSDKRRVRPLGHGPETRF